jgi:hypothetical protein
MKYGSSVAFCIKYVFYVIITLVLSMITTNSLVLFTYYIITFYDYYK